MNNCNRNKDLMIEYISIDGEEEQNLPLEVKTHFNECISCQNEWKAMCRVSNLFSKMPIVEPSQEVLEAILYKSNGNKLNFVLQTASDWLDHMISLRWNMAPLVIVFLLFFAVLTFIQTAYLPRPNLANKTISNFSPNFKPEELKSYGLRSVAVDEQGGVNDHFDSHDVIQDFEKRRQMLLEADADTLFMRGRRYKTAGRMDLALRDFETIYHYYPDYTYLGDVLMYRSQCYAFLGKMDKALESLHLFVKKYPSKEPLITPMMEQLKRTKTEGSPPLEDMVP